jgi:hypothetical protein
MDKNSPLDFLLLENIQEKPLFGESSVGEVTLPGDFEEDFTPSEDHEASETETTETDEELETLSSELDKIKIKLEALKVKYPEDTDGEVAKALDDATSAIDLATHHLGDIGEDLGGEEGAELPLEEPTGELPLELEDNFNA